MNIELLTVKDIQIFLAHRPPELGITWTLRLVLAWAHERARVLELEHRINWHSGEKCDEDEPPDWVAYVLEEIGWKE